ncbi:uncharacterized protein LOC118418796 [Branchiostoma floridae]|uniref:Uncharacterized protein LOC118418796 n=1 Tax=Branchiostoma floridae TaxID=7739 RepID=A0A9J7MVT9_BRAFL|nr:uncharacterized protein LOC118418796 [Branchiostoma floridae]
MDIVGKLRSSFLTFHKATESTPADKFPKKKTKWHQEAVQIIKKMVEKPDEVTKAKFATHIEVAVATPAVFALVNEVAEKYRMGGIVGSGHKPVVKQGLFEFLQGRPSERQEHWLQRLLEGLSVIDFKDALKKEPRMGSVKYLREECDRWKDRAEEAEGELEQWKQRAEAAEAELAMIKSSQPIQKVKDHPQSKDHRSKGERNPHHYGRRSRSPSPSHRTATSPSHGTATSPSRETGTSPSRETGTSPSRGTGTSPSRETGTSPSRGTGTSPSREIATSPSRGTGTSPSRGTGTSPSRGTGTSPSRGTGTSPSRGTGTSPSRGTGTSPAREIATSPAREIATSPAREIATSPAREIATSPARKRGPTARTGRHPTARTQPTRQYSRKRKSAASSTPAVQKKKKHTETVYPPKPLKTNQLVAVAYKQGPYVGTVKRVQGLTADVSFMEYRGDGVYAPTNKPVETVEHKYVFAVDFPANKLCGGKVHVLSNEQLSKGFKKYISAYGL